VEQHDHEHRNGTQTVEPRDVDHGEKVPGDGEPVTVKAAFADGPPTRETR
jgi:hypothetical protein